jgi:hypothetical protein
MPTVINNLGSGNYASLDLKEAADFLYMSPAVLRQKAKLGLIKWAKPGKCWVFLADDLANYLRSLYLEPGQTPCSGQPKENLRCHSINAAIPGGRGSPHQG